MVEIDSGREQEFQSKLADALTELRGQHEEQVRIYKEEIEKTYNSKVSNVHWSQDNARIVSGVEKLCCIYYFYCTFVLFVAGFPRL